MLSVSLEDPGGARCAAVGSWVLESYSTRTAILRVWGAFEARSALPLGRHAPDHIAHIIRHQ
jgi:hypothetical protein